MPESRGFVDFAVELLSRLGPVRARAMFGGHGVYCGELMIGLVDDDELFLKTDAETRPRFEAAGCRRWVYTGGGRTVESSYFQPPDEAHGSPEDMEPWGRLALLAARRAAAARRGKAAAKGTGKTTGKGKGRAGARRKPGKRPAPGPVRRSR